MTNISALADSFARVVFLLRDMPDDREAQKEAFRALLIRISDQPFTITVGNGRLLVDGEVVNPETPGTTALRRQFLGHGMGELSVPAGLNPGQLLTVVRAVAAPAGAFPRLQQLADHFTVSGVDGVAVKPPLPTASLNPTESNPRMAPVVPPAVPSADPGSVATTEESGEPELAALGPDAVNEESVGLLHFVTMEVKSLGRLDELLLELDRNPDSPEAAGLLNEVMTFGQDAAAKEQWVELVRVGTAMVNMEARTSEESQRRLYGIALRRMIQRASLEQVALLLTNPDHRADATAILRRMGADSTEVLVQLLVREKDVGRRRVFFNAVTQMTEGTDLLVHMLGHDEWFVVRNVAELCGEMGLEAAVPELIKRLDHSDDRVRKAAASALGRIGSPASVEPLRKALHDPSPMVRLQAVSALDSSKARNLVPVLSQLVEEEENNDVQREMLHALGRIGTAEAVVTLSRVSEPARGLFKKKSQGLRLEAVEGLRLAGSPEAVAVLKELQSDKDDLVRRAAGIALRRANA